MKKSQKKFKLFQQRSKSEKKSQTITRCKIKQSPKIKNKTLSLYKIDNSKKQYARPINEEENNFQFWGLPYPPKKIKVKNPFIKEQKSNDKDLTGQTSTLLKKYLIRKTSLSKKNVLIKTQSMENVHCPSVKMKIPKNKILINDIKTWDTKDSDQLDKKFFSSTAISQHQDLFTQPCIEQFKPIKENVFLEKILELKQKISTRNNMLTKIRKNMDGIRFKNMSMFD